MLLMLNGGGQALEDLRGYMPLVGHLAENGLVVFDEFREGNDSSGNE
ncbi:MAG: hypothetical protein RRA15_13940 [bacterium]|nr:hypothetical protein [bacterium]